MGKNDQQRRVAKRRGRAANLAAATRGEAGGQSSAGPPRADRPRESPVDPAPRTAELIAAGAALAFGASTNEAALDQVVQALVVLQSADEPLRPAGPATDEMLRLAGVAWENNWQPLDLAHIVRRHQGSRGAALVVAVIIEQAGRERAADRAPAEWSAQLESLAAGQNAAGQHNGGQRNPGQGTPGQGTPGQGTHGQGPAGQGTHGQGTHGRGRPDRPVRTARHGRRLTAGRSPDGRPDRASRRGTAGGTSCA